MAHLFLLCSFTNVEKPPKGASLLELIAMMDEQQKMS